MSPRLRIGIDTGGTFTDIAALGPRGLRVHKVASTPTDPARAVLAGLAAARGAADHDVDVVHGTTVGLNAVLTGRLARVAFVTNRGFEDLIEIGRQTRTDLYDLTAAKPVPPVPRRLRFGIAQRRAADGSVLQQPTRRELDALRRRLAAAGVEAIAIGLLHSYAHPDDEHAVARALAPLGVPITCSAELLAAHGEYERFTAAILNAAIVPIMGSYLARLDAGVAPGRLRLMRSSGGIMAAAEAARFPARAVFSGPAGGVLAARRLAASLRLRAAAALDIGGTSTDVSLVGAHTPVHDGGTLGGLPLNLPAFDVHTIGCGGGSIAYADAGGALRVGPHSAGAEPGPACYGRGDDATVTDAHMVLGHMGEHTLLGGAFPVDPARSLRAIARLSRRLRLSIGATARGVLEVAEVAMVRALMTITVERAVDPAGVALIAFGGAGGLHAASLARRLAMPCAVVPRDPGAFSAIGLALAGESHEVIAPVLRELDALSPARLRVIARDLAAAARTALAAEPTAGIVATRIEARLRFAGQGSALVVPFGAALAARFRRAHAACYGFVLPDAAIEIVELRARAEHRERALPRGAQPRGRGRAPAPALRRRPLVAGPTWPVYRRDDLAPGDALVGPCLIEELTGVTIVPAGARARVMGTAALMM